MDVDGDDVGERGQNGDATVTSSADALEALAKHISLYEESEWLAMSVTDKWEALLVKVCAFLALAGLDSVDADHLSITVVAFVIHSIPSETRSPGHPSSATTRTVRALFLFLSRQLRYLPPLQIFSARPRSTAPKDSKEPPPMTMTTTSSPLH